MEKRSGVDPPRSAQVLGSVPMNTGVERGVCMPKRRKVSSVPRDRRAWSFGVDREASTELVRLLIPVVGRTEIGLLIDSP